MPTDFEILADTLTRFYYTHTYVVIGLALAFVLLAVFRPKAMLKTTGLVLALALAVHFFTLFVDMAGSGRSQKQDMIHTVE